MDKVLLPGLLALFGSGEMDSSGRRVHELLVKSFPAPVKIALVTTPAGFEASPDFWYAKLRQFLIKSLANFKPQITLTNKKLPEKVDYVHAGAGSPTYAARVFKNSPLWREMIKRWQQGAALSLASASALAAGRFVLPVYEIYKAGEDLHWQPGLDLFSRFGLNLTIVTHWNNREGGRDIDTSRCFMGQNRWRKLLKLLSKSTTIVGIDELTALIFWLDRKIISVSGKGQVTLINQSRKIKLAAGKYYHLNTLKTLKIIPSVVPKMSQPILKPLTLLPASIRRIVTDRELARKKKDFKLADKLRQKLLRLGYDVRDSANLQLEVYNMDHENFGRRRRV